MKLLIITRNFLILLTFSISTVFAQPDEIHDIDGPVHHETPPEKVETLEEEVAPPALPAIIDLSENEKKEKNSQKYENLALFTFNIVLFTAGMAIVKSLVGKNV